MPLKEVEFSSLNIAPSPETEGAFFDTFTKRYQAKAKLLKINWNDAWNELVRYGLNSHGPDVSEIGTTWVGGLYSMDALRPFTSTETALLGGAEAFLPVSWQSCNVGKNNLTLGIPVILDVRVVLYRRDWLQKAGVNEATAFIDSGHFADTLRCLKAAGYSSSLGMSTSQSVTRLIHNMACWVWSAGGEIRSNDGQRMLLMEAKSRAGMQAYFELNEFISPEMQTLAEHQIFEAFATGKCAVAVLSEGSYLSILAGGQAAVLAGAAYIDPQVRENMGLAMLMQTPFIGGTVLSIWRHCHNFPMAVKLIQYLTSVEAWKILNSEYMPFIPARLDALAQSPIVSTPFYPAIQKSLQNGRSFQNVYRWGGVELRLVAVIQSIWDDLRTNPQLNIAHEIEQRFSIVCTRLEETILVSG